MTTDVRTPQTPRRVVAATLVLGIAMLGTIVGGDARERTAIPPAAAGVTRALGATANLVSCLEGVQDDLYGGVRDDGTIRPEHAEAGVRRLAGCDPGRVEAELAAIQLPAQAPVTDEWHREVRRDITDAIAVLERAVIEARTAQRAFAARIEGTRDQDREVAVAFRAVAAAYETAGTIEHRIEAALRMPTPALDPDAVRQGTATP